jgi:hypothetical protein
MPGVEVDSWRELELTTAFGLEIIREYDKGRAAETEESHENTVEGGSDMSKFTFEPLGLLLFRECSALIMNQGDDMPPDV